MHSEQRRRAIRPLAALLGLLCLPALLGAAQVETVTRHGYVPFGEPAYPADFTHFNYVNPDAPKGGTLKLLGIGSFDSLNPYILQGQSPADSPGLYVFGFLPLTDTLMMGGSAGNRVGDEAQASYGLVASTLTWPDDLAWVEFELRPQARFQDGHRMDAEDVVFSFNILRDKGHPRYALMFKDVTGVRAINDHRVRFTLGGSNRRDLPSVLGQLPVLPAHYWRDRDFDKATLDAPVISGPYRIESVKPGAQLVMRRNADYWGKDLPVNRGRYNFDRIVVDYFRDAQVAFESFKSGRYDIHLDYIAKHWATAYQFPAIDDGRVTREEIPHRIAQGTQGFFFNTRRPQLADPRVRQALGLMFDFAWTNRAIFNGAYKRQVTWFPNSANASSGVPQGAERALLEPFAEQLPAALFTEPFALAEGDGQRLPRQQMRKALALFNAAGWEIRDGVLVNAESGTPFSMEILNYHSPGMDRVVLPWLENLKRLGVQAEYRSVDHAAFKERLDTYDFDATIYVLPQRDFPGQEIREYFHSGSRDMSGGRNLAGIDDPVVDALVETVLSAHSLPDYRAAVHALDRVLLWRHYIIPHWYLDYHRLAWWDKFGRPDAATPYALGTETWWSKQP
ncbi:MAG: extracellular solute-binding protein [Alcanivoracaceae bacterium]|nr:extracellular solute-binding protein [Alcanivoracaceae bacterium]